MSGWGILAAGLAGGARAVGGIAEGKIDQERRLESAQAIADIEEQKQKRIAEYQQQMRRADQTYNTTGQGGAELLGFEAKKGRQTNTIALEGRRAEATDAGITSGLVSRTTAVAQAQHKTQVEQTIADSGNLSLLKAMADLTNADPSKRADINLKNAHANEANARAGYLKAGGAAGAKAPGPEKMDEADKIEYQNLFGQVKTELGNLSKFEAEGMPLDNDGKQTPQYGLVKQNVARAQRALLSFQMRKGLLDPADMAKSATDGETDSAKIGTAIAQAYELGGNTFGDKFYEAVRASGALERNAEGAGANAAPRIGKGDGIVNAQTRQEALAERQLRTAADYADRQRQTGEMEQQAQAAFSKLAPGDRRAASRMRDDPLFEYLTLQQKASVMSTLSGM